jgi:integrase
LAKLSPLSVKHAKPGRHADGQGLYLLVSPSGSKSWVLRVQVDNRRRDYGLGSLDLVSLSEARERALEWRKLAKEGLDPSYEAKRQRALKTSFEDAAKAFHEERKPSWKNPKHADQWLNTLATYAFPSLGKISVDRIDAEEIAAVLRPIWSSKGETARRVRQRIGRTLDYAKAKGWRNTEAPMSAVDTLLQGIKQPKKRNFAALPYKSVPAFMRALERPNPTIGRLALQFLILTACRSGEVRGATWGEVDLKHMVWTIPGTRMKMGLEHQVPLSPAAMALLQQAKRHSCEDSDALVFPGNRRKPLSDMTLSKVLKTNGAADYTVHGFRSSFRDWAAEEGYSSDWAEAALAHTVRNKVEAAYRRTTFLEQRIGLMNDWANFCAGNGGKRTER